MTLLIMLGLLPLIIYLYINDCIMERKAKAERKFYHDIEKKYKRVSEIGYEIERLIRQAYNAKVDGLSDDCLSLAREKIMEQREIFYDAEKYSAEMKNKHPEWFSGADV